jgi:hypothetical protein
VRRLRRAIDCIRGQREINACAARCQSERTVKFSSQPLGRGKLSQEVGLGVIDHKLPFVK